MASKSPNIVILPGLCGLNELCTRCEMMVYPNHKKLCEKFCNLAVKNSRGETKCYFCDMKFRFRNKAYHHIKLKHFSKKIVILCKKISKETLDEYYNKKKTQKAVEKNPLPQFENDNTVNKQLMNKKKVRKKLFSEKLFDSPDLNIKKQKIVTLDVVSSQGLDKEVREEKNLKRKVNEDDNGNPKLSARIENTSSQIATPSVVKSWGKPWGWVTSEGTPRYPNAKICNTCKKVFNKKDNKKCISDHLKRCQNFYQFAIDGEMCSFCHKNDFLSYGRLLSHIETEHKDDIKKDNFKENINEIDGLEKSPGSSPDRDVTLDFEKDPSYLLLDQFSTNKLAEMMVKLSPTNLKMKKEVYSPGNPPLLLKKDVKLSSVNNLENELLELNDLYVRSLVYDFLLRNSNNTKIAFQYEQEFGPFKDHHHKGSTLEEVFDIYNQKMSFNIAFSANIFCQITPNKSKMTSIISISNKELPSLVYDYLIRNEYFSVADKLEEITGPLEKNINGANLDDMFAQFMKSMSPQKYKIKNFKNNLCSAEEFSSDHDDTEENKIYDEIKSNLEIVSLNSEFKDQIQKFKPKIGSQMDQVVIFLKSKYNLKTYNLS